MVVCTHKIHSGVEISCRIPVSRDAKAVVWWIGEAYWEKINRSTRSCASRDPRWRVLLWTVNSWPILAYLVCFSSEFREVTSELTWFESPQVPYRTKVAWMYRRWESGVSSWTLVIVKKPKGLCSLGRCWLLPVRERTKPALDGGPTGVQELLDTLRAYHRAI